MSTKISFFSTYRFVLVLLTCLPLLAATQDSAEPAKWLRKSAISPNGKQIVFGYQGDLFIVERTGGTAKRLTLHEGYDTNPVWSHDGKTIAFSSDRHGNFDIFTISPEGGKPARITFHSRNDKPLDFSPDDSKILFSSVRRDTPTYRQFPSGAFSELYEIPATGGRPKMKMTTPAANGKYSKDGKTFVFEDVKGYEDEFRKHHTSSVTRDIWIHNFENNSYTKCSEFVGEDRNPVFAPSGQLYFLTEKNGTMNVAIKSAGGKDLTRVLTNFEKNPVRYLSVSDKGILCFSQNGALYTLKEGETPKKIDIFINDDAKKNDEKIINVSGGPGDFDISADGKQMAFIFHGEVFVSSVEGDFTKRITNTAEQERSVSFAKDGRSLVYASERDNSWNLYTSELNRKDEKYFFNATTLTEKVLLANGEETFQPIWSPTKDEVAFLENRTAVKIIDTRSKAVREIASEDVNYSYTDGDQYFSWSPDGNWLAINILRLGTWNGEIGLVPSNGTGQIKNITNSGFSEGGATWCMDGEVLLFSSDRDGRKNRASWGGEGDVYAYFLTQDAWDKYRLSEDEYKLMNDLKKDRKEEPKPEKDKKDKKEKEEKTPKALKIDWDGLEYRKAKLTPRSVDGGSAFLDDKGEHLYFVDSFKKGQSIWSTNLRSGETKVFADLDARYVGMMPSKDGKFIFASTESGVKKIDLSSGKPSGISTGGEMVLNAAAERAYLFEHMWRQVKEKFYVKDLQGVDWDYYKTNYAQFLPHINNNFDFAELADELLGELNASHTGSGYRARHKNPDQTAALGLIFDEKHDGAGLKIAEVFERNPIIKKGSEIKAGLIIEKINGNAIGQNENFYPLLNRIAGKNTLLSLYDPNSKKRWDEIVQPISVGSEDNLAYHRWVKNCEKMTEELSGGKIGYVHVRGMNNNSFKTVYDKALGEHSDKEALIVDTRFNGGGWLHDDLATFLAGKKYLDIRPRGQNLGSEPMFKWQKPSAVLMSEGNYSDAHIFPFVYKELGVGTLVGTPVAGTGTAVWWETLQDNTMYFGIPQVGMVDARGNYMENTELQPDVLQYNTYENMIEGKDEQIEAAVKALLNK